MNKLILILLVLFPLIGGFFVLNNYIYQQKQGVADYRDATYVIAGVPVTLKDGYAERAAAAGSTGSPQADSASKIITRYFGNEAKGDLDGDMIPDIAFLITQEGGGSGTFFYLVGAIQTPAGTYNGTHAAIIGDRIAPQTTEYRGFSGLPGGYVIVNYAERAAGEPMTAQPSVGKSIWLKLDSATMQFGEIVQNFEGESAYETTCKESEEYLVIERGRASVGSDIMIKHKVDGETPPCRFAVSAGDIDLSSESPTYVLGIEGHYLLLDSGTAPPPRGLAVYDIEQKKEIYSDMYNRPIEIGRGEVTYWQPFGTEKDLNEQNCPEYASWKAEGLGGGLERHVSLDLATQTLTQLNEIRCSARQ